MNRMSESKIIQEADESQQFQQNPQYFHRNVNPDEVSTDISSLSHQVTQFITKLRNSFPASQNKPINLISSKKYPNSAQNSSILDTKSQIQQISINTQNLISALSWVSQPSKVDKLRKIKSRQQGSLDHESKISLINQRLPTKKEAKSHIFDEMVSAPNIANMQMKIHSNPLNSNYKTIPFSFVSNSYKQKKNTISSQYGLSKTRNISREKFTRQITSSLNKRSKNKPQFERSEKYLLDQFDDNQTVVNQSSSKVKKNYSKDIFPFDLQSGQKKITKKRLLQKILDLQNKVQQLRFDRIEQIESNLKYKQNQNSTSFSNRGNLLNRQIQNKKQRKNSHQFHNTHKNIQQFQNQKQNMQSQNFFVNISKNSQNTKRKNSLEPKTHAKTQDRKVSLKQWAQQLWEGKI